MNVNYDFSIITSVLLSILLFYNLSWPRLPIPRTKSFLVLMIMEVITLAFDILSNWAVVNAESCPDYLIQLTCVIYFTAFIVRSYAFFGYTALLFELVGRGRNEWARKTSRAALAFFLGLTVTSPFTGLVFSFDRAEGYHKGPLHPAIYFWMAVLIALGFLLIIFRGGSFRQFERNSLLSAYAILITGTSIRFLSPRHIAMNSFFMLSTVILFLTFENVDLLREQRTQTFNYQAFEMVIREYLNSSSSFWMCAVLPRHYQEAREIYGGEQMDHALGLIARYLKKSFPKMPLFYERSGCFLLLCRTEPDRVRVRRLLQERFEKAWLTMDTKVYLSLVYAETARDLKVDSLENFLEGVRRLLDLAGSSARQDYFFLDQEMVDSIRHEFSVRRALNAALSENRVQVYLQPIVDAVSGKTVAAEALARIEDPVIGLVMPGEFIPIAERNGSISQLGEQMFSKVCHLIRDHDLDGQKLQFINVNLSPIQCMDRKLPLFFDEIREKAGVPADRIHLEITEEALGDEELLKSQMEELIRRGFSFVLDDYGSGYANLFRMEEYPFSGIKLDMKIVWNYFQKPTPVLPSTVKTFSSMKIAITAEGVENKEMMESLCGMGCTYLQGFYFSKPVPAETFFENLDAS